MTKLSSSATNTPTDETNNTNTNQEDKLFSESIKNQESRYLNNSLLTSTIDTDYVTQTETNNNNTSTSSTCSSSLSCNILLKNKDSPDQDASSTTNSLSNLNENQLSSSLNSVSSADSSTNNKNNNNSSLIISINDHEIAYQVQECLNKLINKIVNESDELKKPIITTTTKQLEELINDLKLKLSDLRYIELNDLKDQLNNYEHYLNKKQQQQQQKDNNSLTSSLSSSSSSSRDEKNSNTSSSLNIEDFLTYFEFLNDEENNYFDLLPQDFCSFLINSFQQCNHLIEDLKKLKKSHESLQSIFQFEKVILSKLTVLVNDLKDFYSIIINNGYSSKMILNKILNNNSMRLNEWLKLTQNNKYLLNVNKLDFLSNLNNNNNNLVLNRTVVDKMTATTTKTLDLINIYQFNNLLDIIDLINEIDMDNFNENNINIDYLFDNRVYSSTILTYLINENITIGMLFFFSYTIKIYKLIRIYIFMKIIDKFILRLKTLNSIKTADILITLTWEALNDSSSSEEFLKILINYLKLLNETEV